MWACEYKNINIYLKGRYFLFWGKTASLWYVQNAAFLAGRNISPVENFAENQILGQGLWNVFAMAKGKAAVGNCWAVLCILKMFADSWKSGNAAEGEGAAAADDNFLSFKKAAACGSLELKWWAERSFV